MGRGGQLTVAVDSFAESVGFGSDSVLMTVSSISVSNPNKSAIPSITVVSSLRNKYE